MTFKTTMSAGDIARIGKDVKIKVTQFTRMEIDAPGQKIVMERSERAEPGQKMTVEQQRKLALAKINSRK